MSRFLWFTVYVDVMVCVCQT